jgi:hypothetical protein
MRILLTLPNPMKIEKVRQGSLFSMS